MINMGAWNARAAWSVAVAAMAVTAAPREALADPANDAKELFGRGREMRGHGDCAGAVPLFRKAYEVYPAGLGSLRNLAECEERMEEFRSARRDWLTLKEALAGVSDPRYAGWTADVAAAASRLAAKVPVLVVTATVAAAEGSPAAPTRGAAGDAPLPTDGIEVTINGEAIDRSSLGKPLERDPGHYVVRIAGARLAGPDERTIELAAGDSQQVDLRAVLKREEAPPVAVVTPPERPANVVTHPEGDHGRAAKRTAGWIGIGVGAAAAIGAGVSFIVRQGASSHLESVCPSYQSGCDASLKSTLQPAVDRGHLASTLVTVFGAVGAVGLGAGIVLLATTPWRPVEVSAGVSPAGLSLLGRFR
jgi:hypothetical protein